MAFLAIDGNSSLASLDGLVFSAYQQRPLVTCTFDYALDMSAIIIK